MEMTLGETMFLVSTIFGSIAPCEPAFRREAIKIFFMPPSDLDFLSDFSDLLCCNELMDTDSLLLYVSVPLLLLSQVLRTP
jgi:hypothetical protein